MTNVYGVRIVEGRYVVTFDGAMTRVEAQAERDRLNVQLTPPTEQPISPAQPQADYCGIMGIGGLGIYAENEAPFVPSERAIERYEKLAAQARTCRRCGQTDVFDGAMFTTSGGDVCDDCF